MSELDQVIARLARIEQNALPHLQESLSRVELRLSVVLAFLIGAGVKELVQWLR